MAGEVIKSKDVKAQVGIDQRLDFDDRAEATLMAGRKILHKEELKELNRAKSILKEAEDKAKLVKDKAKELYLEVESRVKEATKLGFEKGREEGLKEVTQQLILLEKQKQELVTQLERDAVKLVYDIAHKIIGDTLVQSDEAIVGLVQQALRSSLGNELTVYVSPTDFDRIRNQEQRLLGQVTAVQTLHLKPSERVKEGGCIIESELGTIEAHLEHQLEAIRHALQGKLSEEIS